MFEFKNKFFFLIVALYLFGCEYPNTSESIETNNQNDLKLFYEDFETVLCDLNFKCNFGVMPIDKKVCKIWVKNNLYTFQKVSKDQQLDKDAIKYCIDTLMTATCEDFQNILNSDQSVLVSECINTVKGFKKMNEPCAISNECSPGLVCSNQGENCGQCVPDLDICGDIYCQKDQYCNENQICENLKREGESCLSSENCEEKLFCFGNICSHRQTIDQPCNREGYTYDPCEEGLSCYLVMQDSQNRQSFCKKRNYNTQLGEFCDLTLNLCGAGLRCDQNTQLCVARTPNDQDCIDSNDCLLGSACYQGTCTGQVDLGAACSEHQQCVTGFCSNNVCENQPTSQPTSQACRVTSDTQTNFDDVVIDFQASE